jgi:4-amino-4-deoxy-L-arabinose transferase-like glycosyltransferase
MRRVSPTGLLPLDSSFVPESTASAGREERAPANLPLPPHSDALALAAPTVLAAVMFFFHLGRFGLWEPDEARYAEIAREMLALHDYLIPHLNYVIYVEKPPLLYWLTALAYGVLGIDEFAARFFVAVFGALGVAATAFFALRTFGRRHALVAGAILATTPLYAVMAQVLTTDMILAALTTVATFALYLHWRNGGAWCWLAYVAMALAILTKGPVGAALPILTIAIFLVWERDLRGALRRFHAIAGLAVVLLIAAPWFMVTTLRVPGYFDFYFVGEHLRRIFEPSYSHGEPIWFYLPVLIVGLLPWSLLVPLMTWRALAPNPARRFCVVSAAVVIGAFSLASAKLIPYILPAVPPLAVLIADGVVSCAWPELAGVKSEALRPPDSRILAEAGPLLGLWGVGVIVAGLFAARFRSPYPMEVRPALFAIGTIMVAGGAVTALAFFRRRAGAEVGAIVLTLAVALLAGTWARIEAEPLRSYAALARTVAERAPDATAICYHRYVQALPFYTRRRVILVGPKTELRFGANRAPDAYDWFFKTDADLMRLWGPPGHKVLVLDAPDLARLRDQLGDFTLIASEFRKRAIVKPGERVAGN